ncbi:type I polyketide synthase, partial [Microbispora amethystogenes]
MSESGFDGSWAARIPDGGAALAARLTGLPLAEQNRLLLDLVCTQTAAVLRKFRPDDPAEVSARRAFRDLGLDSIALVELQSLLNAVTGLALGVSAAFDHPTPASLAAFLRTELLGDAGAETGPGTGPGTGPRTGAEPVAGERRALDEPIAIVGIGCRLPGGVDSPEGLWRLVDDGRHVLTDFPDDRGWDLERLFDPDPDQPGTTYLRRGGFLPEATLFDADFFGISPREAQTMDPQQRLVLETAWEAIERAGIDPASLAGSRSGVYIGVEPQEYGPRIADAPDGLDGYLITGNATSVVAGRVAYTLGLLGPALAIDTACSGSLVAVHVAAQALRNGECGLALVGGVAVLSSPGVFTAFSRLRGLAPDGICKPFAEAADGTGFSEGAAVLVLERLSDARRNGHTVHAVLRGSAINQDGASNGLTAPSGRAQRMVIRQALADAGLAAADVDVVEAHGTGTTLGDPIEAQAIIDTYGQGREPDDPLWLGSVKSNIGHTQAAAGVVGLIKMVLAMRHGVLPKTLHVDQPSSAVNWSAGRVSLLTEPVPWQENGRPRRAGVSAFGVSGTNAHVIIEEPPSDAATTPAEDASGAGTRPVDDASAPSASPADAAPASEAAVPDLTSAPDQTTAPCLVPVSARGDGALRAQAARLHDMLAADETVTPADAGYSLVTTRTAFPDRAVVLAAGRDECLRGLRALSQGETGPDVVRGSVTGGALAYLFTGQGSQRLDMGRELCGTYPVFAAALDDAAGYLDLQLDRPLLDVLFAEPGTPEADLLHQTAYAQPALFAVQVAAYRLLESWGVRPDYVAGHSIGELAAAHVAGVLSLEDAATLVAARGRLMQALPADGAMVAIQAAEDEVTPLLTGRAGIAAVNGPRSVVVSGDEAEVLAIAARFEADGRKTRRLRVSHAFHSPLMEPMLAEFARVAGILAYSPPSLPVVSTVTGELATAEELCSPDYWVRHVRDAVRFRDGVAALHARGVDTFVEIGPDGVLSAMAQDCLADASGDLAFVPVLRRDRGEVRQLLSAVAVAHTRGTALEGSAYGPDARRVDLPTYAFQGRRFWMSPQEPNDALGLGQAPADHPLLGAVLRAAGEDRVVLTGRLSLRTHPWLADHVISGRVLLPGTALLELAVYAGDQAGCPQVEDLTLHAPLVVPERGGVSVQVVVAEPDDAGRRVVDVFSRPDGDGD